MIEIPEEKLLKEITDLLMNELPKVLLELEVQSEEVTRLSPFRYVGLAEKLPAGTGLPYALLEIEDTSLTEKDRIIKSVSYLMKITVKPAEPDLLWRYFAGIEEALSPKSIESYRLHLMSKNRNGKLMIQVTMIKK